MINQNASGADIFSSFWFKLITLHWQRCAGKVKVDVERRYETSFMVLNTVDIYVPY